MPKDNKKNGKKNDNKKNNTNQKDSKTLIDNKNKNKSKSKKTYKKQKGGQMVLKDEGMKRNFLNSIKMTKNDNPEVIEMEKKAEESALWPGRPPNPDCTIM